MTKEKNYSDNELTKGKLTTVDICEIAAFAAIMAVLSQISIPMPAGVPMTLQTLIVPLAGIVIGRKKGTLATLLYLLMGAVGIPVFASFQGGLGILLGMTGGFLISFPVLSYTAGLGHKLGVKVRTSSSKPALYYATVVTALILGAVINYAFGTVWFMIIAQADLAYSLAACVIPFIPTSIIKIAIVAIVGPELKKRLDKVLAH